MFTRVSTVIYEGKNEDQLHRVSQMFEMFIREVICAFSEVKYKVFNDEGCNYHSLTAITPQSKDDLSKIFDKPEYKGLWDDITFEELEG